MSEVRRFAKNYVFIALSWAILVGGNTILTLVVGWGLPVADFGRFRFAITLTGLLNTFVGMGIGQWAISHVPRNLSDGPVVAGRMFSIRAMLMAPYVLLLTAVCAVSRFDLLDIALTMLLGLGAGLQIISLGANELAQAIERNALGTVVALVRNVVKVGLVVGWMLLPPQPKALWFDWLILPARSLTLLAALWLISEIPGLWAAVRIIARKGGGIQWRSASLPWRSVLRWSLPFAMVSFVCAGNGQIETVLLKYLAPGDAEERNRVLGYFSMAVALTSFAAVPAVTLLDVFRPIVSRRFGVSQAAFHRSIHLAHKSMFLLAAGAFGFLAMFPHAVLHLLFRDTYAAAALMFRLVAIGWFLQFLPPAPVVLHMTGYQNRVLVITVVRFILVVGVNFLTVPWLGPLGAAVTGIVAGVAAWAVTLVYFRMAHYPVIESTSSAIRGVAAAAVPLLAALGVHLLGAHILITAATWAVVFVPASYVLGLSESERRNVREVLDAVRGKLGARSAAAAPQPAENQP